MAFFILTGAAGHASAPVIPSITSSVTGYNAVPAQTDGDPTTTASGAFSNPNIVAARSRDLAETLPFGTVVAIESAARTDECGMTLVAPSIGYRVIADTMNARIVNTVDVLFAVDDTIVVHGKQVNAARALGVCNEVTIRVVGKLDITKPSKLPKTQAELVALFGTPALAFK